MTLSRRKTLALIGGGTILAASAGAAAFLTTRTPKTAIAPWELAGSYDDIRKRALSFALLAPNPHNLQPWVIGLRGDDTVEVFHDTSKRLPHTDPFDRQIRIGFGCFLEQMVIAASLEGYDVALDLFPDGDTGPIARATFSQGATPDPLGQAMMDRRSCKEPFQMTPVPDEIARALAPFGMIITEPTRVSAIRELSLAAWDIEVYTPCTMQESVDLMRFGKSEINANPDGISLGGPFLESLMVAGILKREDQNDPDSAGFKQGVDMFRKMMSATPAYAVLVSDSNEPVDQIETGRRWLRLNLATTMAGLALHPISQCLQEYPEMAAQYDQAHQLMAGPGQTVQMLGRLGYGPQTPRTPRWPLEAKLKTA